MEAVRYLAGELGPRPACSDAEERAARWCVRRFEENGLHAQIERFQSRPSSAPWIAGYLGLSAAGAVLVPIVPLIGFVLSLTALVLYARDCDGRPLIPPRGGISANVIARRAEEARPSLVVVAELDSGRASARFNPAFPPGPRGWAVVVHGALVILPTVAAVAWVAEATRPLPRGTWLVALALTALLVIASSLELHSFRNLPVLDGANDNASGIETVLELSRRFGGSDVWWVLVGSGHAGQIGMQAFLETHEHELGGARILCVRGVGAGELSVLADEGLLRARRADPALMDAAVEAGADMESFRAVQSAAAVAGARHRRAATIAGLDGRGAIALQGWPGDTVSALDESKLIRATSLIARVIEVSTGHVDMGARS